MATDSLSIRSLTERVLQGTIRIPKFQREYVWEPENVAFLMDSIYRGYPIGTILLWRTHERLSSKTDLGPFELPEPAKEWPVDFVLDGQQRLTSFFGVFQTKLVPKSSAEEFNVFFDLDAKEGALEDQFVARPTGAVVESNLFPLRLLLDPAPFSKATRDKDDPTLERLTDLQRRFQEAPIKVEVIDVTDREQVAMIFERINRAGVPLDTFQLLTAWTWSNEFDLNEKIEVLGSEVDPYGFAKIGTEQDLLMKCCAAVIRGDANLKTIIELKGQQVRDRFEAIKRGILGAIEFLRSQLNVHSLEIMPYPAMIVPLSCFFATDAASGFHPSAKQTHQLKRWFWRSCYSRRYSSGVGKAHAADISAMGQLKVNEDHDVASFPVSIDDKFFLDNNFNIGAVNTKVFVLMLAARQPRSLISNAPVRLDDVLLRCNRNEFHHIFPKAYLQSIGVSDKVNALANFCFLSSADNQQIKDKSPSAYISLIPPHIRNDVGERAILPNDWYSKTFEDFLELRVLNLVAAAEELAA